MVQSLLPFAQNTFRRIAPRVQAPETESHPPEIPLGCGTPPPLAVSRIPEDRRQKLDINYRHSGWVRIRQAIFDSLHRTNQTFSRIEAYYYCGTDAWVEQSVDDPTKYRIHSDKCHDRFCLPCGQERSRVIAHNVHERLATRRSRFVTLTLKSSTEPLQELLDLLYKSFTKLRRSKVWAGTQTGGVAFLEIKWYPKNNRWHPHLHVLTEGKYIAKQALSNAWRTATGGSFIVDVKLVKSLDRAIAYVAKYASKPHDPSIWRDPRRLDEAIVALKGRRLCLTFGEWRGVKLTEVPDSGTWTPIATLADLMVQAHAGEPAARSILSHLPTTALPADCRAPPDERDAHAEDSEETG